jgi:hypothetical protein
MTDGALQDRAGIDPEASAAAAQGSKIVEEALRMLRLSNEQLKLHENSFQTPMCYRPSPVIRRAGLLSRKETFASYLTGQGTNDLLRL